MNTSRRYICGYKRGITPSTIRFPASGVRAFTLVELLMVVAIIGALSAMAIPAFSSYILSARVSRCIAEIRNIENAITAYSVEHNSYPGNLAIDGISNAPTDPWGNLYLYNNPAVINDMLNLGQLNLDYDLYSKGADGLSATNSSAICADDIVRANDGLYVGKRP